MVKMSEKKTLINCSSCPEEKKKTKYNWQQRLRLKKHFSRVVKHQKILSEGTKTISLLRTLIGSWALSQGWFRYTCLRLGEEIHTACSLWSSLSSNFYIFTGRHTELKMWGRGGKGRVITINKLHNIPFPILEGEGNKIHNLYQHLI